MRAWIDHVDAEHLAFVHASSGENLQSLMDYCAERRATGAVGTKDDRLAMSVDGTVIMAWCNKVGVTWGEFFRNKELQNRFIEDPDHKAFRVWEGRL